MLSFKRIASILFGRTENLFLGIYFLLLKRVYIAEHGKFVVPLIWSRAHFYARFLNDGYEAEERNLISKHLGEGDHVLELGACAGVISCLTEKKIRAGRHCVVEANPNMLPYLYKNRQQNNCTFQIVEAAITDAEEVVFYLNKNMVGGSAERQTRTACRVPGKSLQSVTEQFGPFNTLVLDIEGGEEAFLNTYGDEMPHYQKLIIEFHPSILGNSTVAQLKADLKRKGFSRKDSEGDVDYWERESENRS